MKLKYVLKQFKGSKKHDCLVKVSVNTSQSKIRARRTNPCFCAPWIWPLSSFELGEALFPQIIFFFFSGSG